MSFPSPAKDYQESVIDLPSLLVQHPSSTFYMRVKGNSMEGAHIPDGALLIVDKSVEAKSGMIIVAILNGEFTIRKLIHTQRVTVLHPENPAYKPLVLTGDMDFQIWGVVTGIIIKPNK